MKVLYKQKTAVQDGSFALLGIKECYFKKLMSANDGKNITKKSHHHNAYEVHIMADGYQIYYADGKNYRVDKGNFIIIPPGVQHKIVETSVYTTKYSLTFEFEQNKSDIKCVCANVSREMSDNIDFILCEITNKTEISRTLIANRVFETVVHVLRISGYKDTSRAVNTNFENLHLTLAKQYIIDNIKEALKLSDVAAYCHLSNKQITRIFEIYENVAPAQYIRQQRIKVIEKTLLDSQLSLKEISEEFNFSSEYYFNTFFKKHTGMSPGEYKKMHKVL